MSDLSGDLEGDVEDFEGDVDASEWEGFDNLETYKATGGSHTKDPQTGSSQKPQIARNALKMNSDDGGGSDAQDRENKNEEAIKVKETSGHMANPVHSTKDLNVNTHLAKQKRKMASDEEEKAAPEVSMTSEGSDILMEVESNDNVKELATEEVEDKDEEVASKLAAKKRKQETEQILSEEDYRNIDNFLVEGMIDSIKEELAPQEGMNKYTIRISPVELADLAESTVQDLIKCQPNLAFFFKRQGKFKKKKGYAEVYLTKLQDIHPFINRLLHIKLVESQAEVVITSSQFQRETKFLSFAICFNKNSKLLKLLQTSGELTKLKPDATKVSFLISSAPTSAYPPLLKTIFPYSMLVLWPSVKDQLPQEPGRRGPVSVFYANEKLMEAVLECCTDFTFNGCPLNIQKSKDKLCKSVSTTESKESKSAQERKSLAHDTCAAKERKNLTQNEDTLERTEATTALSISPPASDVDEDISNMTLDVCAGMLESLNKLKQLGTDNPDVLKILEMQSQLAKLQESLIKGSKSSTSRGEQSDPWTVSLSDVQGETDAHLHETDNGQKKKKSKEEKRKQKEERQRKEMEKLEKMIEEADEAEKKKEEMAKCKLEAELKKMKEKEEQKKASWARKMIDDAKQHGSPATKLEAQKILKSFENKFQENSETKKLEGVKKQEEKQCDLPQKLSQKAEKVLNLSGTEKDSEWDTERTQLGTQKSDQVNSEKGDEINDVYLEDRPQTSETESIEQDFQESTVTHTMEVNINPKRTHRNGVPVYSEREYNEICAKHSGKTLPWEHFIQVRYFLNRQCPVSTCPAISCFKTEASFIDHWEIFHKPVVTMRFCSKCSAYFMNIAELETHLSNWHSVTDPIAIKRLSSEARIKVVNNPSFRDPDKYLPPLPLV